jgi:hypothetical protein
MLCHQLTAGYVNTTIPKDALTADFRVLDYVTTPGSSVRTMTNARSAPRPKDSLISKAM